ncbi:hypothetical protein [Paraburkholderia phenazinium]|jgi:hypothetical protein|uniref:Uncharacterized protein n=1 Tax=Paraburkholderia phenazinium TaxID=60549 RepID=A0A1G7VEJ7_9BURK|nr:hypothetical protein [Paraburkholderia phenazinium]SDG57360.1 hypothetical protein SAMN05216466_1049 [Paraburkholderia phenazinium]
MQPQAIANTGLSDAKAFTHRPGEGAGEPRRRQGWIVPLAIAAIPLSLLFVWGFLHLILMLVFANQAIAH